MNQQRGFLTVTELIETILSNARYVIPDDQKNQQAEKTDPATIPRTRSVHDILSTAIQHHLAEPSQAGVVTPQDFADWLVEFGADVRTSEELHKKREIRETSNEGWHMDTESPTPVADVIQIVALLNKESEYYHAHPDSPNVDYGDHDAMLDDGWVLD